MSGRLPRFDFGLTGQFNRRVSSPQSPTERLDILGPAVEPDEGSVAPDQSPAASPLAIETRALALVGDRGIVYGPIDLAIPTGTVAALTSPAGSGRTSLLLTLVGRMAPSSGDIRVLDLPLPAKRRALHQISTLAHFDGIDDLDEGLTVHEVLAERAALLAPLWKKPQRTDDLGVAEICGPLFGSHPLPSAHAQIWHLDVLQVSLLRMALALMGQPRLLVVDDIDTLADPAHQRHVWEGLQRVAASQGTTIVGCSATADTLPPGVLAYDLTTGERVETPHPHHAFEQEI